MYRKKNIIILIVFSLIFLFMVSGSAWADPVAERIAKLNASLQAEGLPWTAGRTSVSDLSLEELRSLCGGPDEPGPVDHPTLSVAEEGGSLISAKGARSTSDCLRLTRLFSSTPIRSL